MPAVTSVTSSGNQDIDGILLNQKWAVSSFKFSFPTSASFYQTGSTPNGELASNFGALNSTQQAYVRDFAFKQFTAVANLTFTEMTETASNHADLRFAKSDATSTAWGYYPATQPYGGDSWYRNSGGSYDNPVIGNYAAHTFMHEIGHTMGLVHGHDPTNPFGKLPNAHDSVEYSIMTYVSYVGGPSTGGYSYGSVSAPQTLMQDDIAALQYLYGANYNTNSGNTVYSWNPTTGQTFVNGVSMGPVAGNKIFLTIWDGNGVDTYDLSAYSSGLSIDLQPGAWSTFNTSALGQRANLGAGNSAAGNVANALLHNGNTQSLIENVIGGSGNDTIIGNVLGNDLKGGGGGDILNGLAGADVLTGGSGADKFRFDASAFGGTQDQITDYSYAANDAIDLSSVVSANAANLASYVKVMQSGSNALLMVDRDGSGAAYSWQTVAQLNNVGVGSNVNLLIGPSSTAMTVTVQSDATVTTLDHTTTTYDTQNQYIWSNFAGGYNGFGQLLWVSFDYDDGAYGLIVYDVAGAEIYSDMTVTYNAAREVTQIVFNYDDGTHAVGSYDVQGQVAYANYFANFDAQWNLRINFVNNDDGTHAVIYWDPYNQNSWTWQQYDYDANWNLTSVHGQNDDGTSFGNGYVGSGDGNEGPASGDVPDALPGWIGTEDLTSNGPEVDDFPVWSRVVDAEDFGNADAHQSERAPDNFPAWAGTIDDDITRDPGTVNSPPPGHGNEWLIA